MDEDQTERVDLPGPADPAATPAGNAAGDPWAAPPGPPPPPAAGQGQPSPPPPPVAWLVPGQGAAAPSRRLDVGGTIGRTFDTLGREWSLFLALAIPAGLAGFAGAVSTTSMQAILRDPGIRSGLEQAPLLVAQLLIALLSLVTTIATIVAADRLWRGSEVGLGEAVGAAAGVLPRAIGLLLVGIVVGIVFGVAIVACLMLIGFLGPGGAFIGILGVVALLAVAFYVGLRLALIGPVLVLENVPLLGVIGRAWRRTKGNVILIFVTALVIGLCGLLPTWGGSLFSLFVDDRIVSGIAAGLASMVVAPLGGIWTVLAWGQLADAPYLDSDVMRTGKGRLLGFSIVAGVGLVLLLVGGTLAAAGSQEFIRLSGG